MTEIFGVSAGVFSSLAWAVSILLFQPALRRYGAFSCNLFKACLALVLFVISSITLLNVWEVPLPTLEASGYLFLSGIVGMAFGDFAFFKAMTKVGPRQATLLHSTHPVFLFLFTLWIPESALSVHETIGVLIVILAVGDVTRNQKSQGGHPKRDWRSGLFWGLMAALAQAAGVVIAKESAMTSHAIHTGMIRLLGAATGMIAGLLVAGKFTAIMPKIFEKDFVRLGALPVFLGTFLGILTMMIAIANCKPAITGAVLSLTPVFLVPLTSWQAKERIPIRILCGTIAALIGVILVSS